MATDPDAPIDSLLKEYSAIFRELDDLTLARWLSQTLGQLQGKVWRFSHPLLGAYRLGAQVGHDRQIWLKRLVTAPRAYGEATCCRAPMLPLLTRDVKEAGLICQHCNETLLPFDEIPSEARKPIEDWQHLYEPVHAVAHWDDRQRKSAGNYEHAFENAAEEAERLLARVGSQLAPALLEHFAAVVWEDQDECLEVRPEDIQL